MIDCAGGGAFETLLKDTPKNSTFYNTLQTLPHKDREFLNRIFANGLKLYETRILNLAFRGEYTRVLDAGSGFGQWSIALSLYNAFVDSVECQENRVKILNFFKNRLNISNLNVFLGSIENLPEQCNAVSYDFVFCYGVIFLTDWKKSIQELLRVTRSGGLIYICANDVGWYYNLIINQPNQTIDYNPREQGILAFINEYCYKVYGEKFSGDMIVRLEDIQLEIKNYPCDVVVFADEGGILYDNGCYCIGEHQLAFFKGKYEGQRGVYEILLRKY